MNNPLPNERFRTIDPREAVTRHPRTEHVINGILGWLIERKIQNLPIVKDEDLSKPFAGVRSTADSQGNRKIHIWRDNGIDSSVHTVITALWDEQYGSSMPASITAHQVIQDDTGEPYGRIDYSNDASNLSQNTMSAAQVYLGLRYAERVLQQAQAS